MMKIKLASAGLAVAMIAMASGCATVSFSSPGALDGLSIKGAGGKPGQLVIVGNVGYYFLWTIPLASGDLRWDADRGTINGGTRLFCDMVDVESVQGALLKIAESRDCDLVDVAFYDEDTSFAGPNYSGLVGSMFGSSRICVSAVLVPRTYSTTADSAGKKEAVR